MLEQLNERLHRLDFIKQEGIDKSFGLTQAYQANDTSQAFTVTGGGRPKIARETEANDTTGTLSEKEKRETAERAPQIPWLTELQMAPSYNAQFGVGPSDLLGQQVELSYQVFNLRMLLERSLNDRIWDSKPRLQTVLGFNVSLSPPIEARNASAVVEVTVRTDPCAPTSKAARARRIALSAIMPQERTYNAAALSQRNNAFGGSAVARLFTVGYSQRRRGTNFFVYRDSDTVAFESPLDASGESVQFGWEFRPVLGRKSVSPGPRQMFAVLSLPAVDDLDSTEPVKLKVTVRTWWRHFDSKTLTTSASRPWMRGGRLSQEAPVEYPLTVEPTHKVQKALAPEIRSVRWFPTSSTSGVLAVTGKNFYTGTTVRLGDKTVGTPEDGLLIKSEQALQVNVPIASIGRDAVLVGRYGSSVPLEKAHPTIQGFQVQSVSTRNIGKQSEIRISIAKDPPSPITLAEREDLGLPVFVVGEKAFNGPYNLQWFKTHSGTCASDRHCLSIIGQVNVPHEELEKSSFQMSYPFWGRGFTQAPRLETPLTNLVITRLFEQVAPSEANATPTGPLAGGVTVQSPQSRAVRGSLGTTPRGSSVSNTSETKSATTQAPPAAPKKASFLIGGSYFQYSESDWAIRISENPSVTPVVTNLGYDEANSHGAIIVTLDENDVPSKKLFLRSADWGYKILQLPEAKIEPKKPSLANPLAQTVDQNDSVSVKFSGGADMNLITRATFEGTVLRAVPEDENKSIRVFLTRAVTAKAGKIEVLLETDGGKDVLRAPIYIKPVPEAEKQAKPAEPPGGSKN